MRILTNKITYFDDNGIEVSIVEQDEMFKELSIFDYTISKGEYYKIILNNPEKVRSLIKTLDSAVQYLKENYSTMMEK